MWAIKFKMEMTMEAFGTDNGASMVISMVGRDRPSVATDHGASMVISMVGRRSSVSLISAELATTLKALEKHCLS